ncbi:MAG: hypothetical protein JW861_07185 [Bacteroidales bacterium]|nr:hypothetical protein [Bacteroidales bacterium]
MKKEDTLHKMSKLSSGIHELLQSWSSGKVEIHRISVDLMMQKLRDLYDLAGSLKDVVSAGSGVTPDSGEEPPASPPSITGKAAEMRDKQDGGEPAPPREKEDRYTGSSSQDLFSGVSLADRFSAGSPTVVDSLARDQKGKSVGEVVKPGQHRDLKSLIGINEKFFFINYLFNGSMKDYQEAIAEVESASGHEHARILLEGLSSRYGWSPDSEAVLQLKKLVLEVCFEE